MATPFILLATERSGTHLLRSFLFSTPGIAAPGEVCNPASEADPRGKELSWFQFKRQACLADESLFVPTAETQTKLLSDYISYVSASVPKKKAFVLDVKYSHVHNFNSFWSEPLRRPFLIHHCIKEDIGLIHLVRRKVAQTALSDAYARETGVYVVRGAGKRTKAAAAKIHMNRERLIDGARQYARTITLFQSWLRRSRHVVLEYEAISRPKPDLTGLGEFLGVDEIVPKAAVSKTTPPYRESVSNYDEVEDLIEKDLNEFL